MNRILVLKDVAYAAKVGGGTIADIKEVNLLSPGALAFFTPQGTLLTQATAAGAVPGVHEVMVASGRSDDNQLLSQVPRTLADVSRGNYRAFVKPVITVGVLSVVDADEGDISIGVTDISYTSKYNVQSVNASTWKTASQTAEVAVAALVDQLNATSSFIVATLGGSAGARTIAITPKEDGVSIAVTAGGLVEGNTIATTTAMVYGLGSSEDVLQMEKDASVEEGNGNYTEYPAEFYSRTMETAATGYDVISIMWQGTHSSPTRMHNVMRNKIAIACVSGVADGVPLGADQSANDVMALIALIFSNVTDSATSVIPGTDDGTTTDGTAGN